jgi:N-acetylmuramoyl-L-alanine amidase
LTFRPLSLFSAIGASLLVAVLSSQTPPTSSITVLAKDGRRPLPLSLVADQEFIALDDLATVFQLTVRDESGAVTVSYKGKTIVLTPDQPLASVSGRLISLPAPPARSGRRWLVPVEFVNRALALVYDLRLDLRKPSRLLVVGDLRVPRISARYDPLGVAGRLTIDATPRATSTVSQDAEHITIKFDADALDVAQPLLPPQALQNAAGIVQAVRAVDPTTIVVDLGPRAGAFKTTSVPADPALRLVIDFIGLQTDAPQVAPAPAPAPVAPPIDLPPLNAQPPAIRTIAIDPGHGGEDEGVRSTKGTKEKDLTLTIARRTRAALEARLGVRVLLTRDDDRNVPIDDRAALANNNNADLFISLHANASSRASASGLTIFTAFFDKSDAEAGAAGGHERLPTFSGGLRDIEMVPWDLAQTRHLEQSTAFAALLEQQFHDRVPLSKHPADRAPLRVLESANMPAVLIEIGFLSNEEQDKLLTSDGFQNAFVQNVYDAVVRFRDTLGGGAR